MSWFCCSYAIKKNKKYQTADLKTDRIVCKLPLTGIGGISAIAISCKTSVYAGLLCFLGFDRGWKWILPY
jgi:hypothetical protein